MFLKIDKYSEYEELFGVVLSEEILKVTGQIIQVAIQKKQSHCW